MFSRISLVVILHLLSLRAVAAGWEATSDSLAPDSLLSPASSCDARDAFIVGRTASVSTGHFRPQQLIFPAAAIAFGGAGVKNHLIDTRSDREKHQFEDQLQYVPIVAYAGLGFIPGVQHEHHFGQRVMAGATAYIVMTAICQGGKRLIREPRPDTEARTSFPSGHTATAFCGAELTRIEYGNAYGAAAYLFAATTGIMRVVNNRHWCNDVLAGAGVGFLSAHIGYWLLPWEKRLADRVFHKNKMPDIVVMPSYDPETNAPSFSFAASF